VRVLRMADVDAMGRGDCPIGNAFGYVTHVRVAFWELVPGHVALRAYAVQTG
jgi:hypothetical protein